MSLFLDIETANQKLADREVIKEVDPQSVRGVCGD